MQRREDEGAWGGDGGGLDGSQGISAAVCLPAALLAIRQPRPASPHSHNPQTQNENSKAQHTSLHNPAH